MTAMRDLSLTSEQHFEPEEWPKERERRDRIMMAAGIVSTFQSSPSLLALHARDINRTGTEPCFVIRPAVLAPPSENIGIARL